jgi:hypothetical protein
VQRALEIASTKMKELRTEQKTINDMLTDLIHGILYHITGDKEVRGFRCFSMKKINP